MLQHVKLLLCVADPRFENMDIRFEVVHIMSSVVGIYYVLWISDLRLWTLDLKL